MNYTIQKFSTLFGFKCQYFLFNFTYINDLLSKMSTERLLKIGDTAGILGVTTQTLRNWTNGKYKYSRLHNSLIRE